MSISEYAVPEDFFQFDYDGHSPMSFDFPCVVCKFNKNGAEDQPCIYCGHNDGAAEHYSCCLCGEIQPGRPLDDSYIAWNTPAQIGPVCDTCKNTLKADLGK